MGQPEVVGVGVADGNRAGVVVCDVTVDTVGGWSGDSLLPQPEMAASSSGGSKATASIGGFERDRRIGRGR